MLGYAVVLCARLPFVTHENTVYVSIIKLAAYLVAVIFMYKGRVTLRLLMYAIHIFTMFTGEFLSINILGAFGLLYNGFFKNNFYLGMLMSELLSSFCVFAVGFAVRRIGKFPTEASLRDTVQRSIRAADYRLLCGGFFLSASVRIHFARSGSRLHFAYTDFCAGSRNNAAVGCFFENAENAAVCG